MNTATKPIDLIAALLDPPALLESPEAVTACGDLSTAAQIEILRRWEYDARELEVAEDEGMSGGEDLLARIHGALHALGVHIDLEAAPPTRQGGVAAAALDVGTTGDDHADAATQAAMCEALDDEYKACASYRAVIAAFGAVRPFVNIVEAEARHAAALLALFARFGLTPPADRWAGKIEPPESLAAACAAAVAAEIENGEMYERLLAAIGHPAVRAVMLRLQAASCDNHLPAFRRCLDRERGGRGGRRREGGGGGRRRRRRGG